MASYQLTNKAVQDLTEIWEYTVEKWSEKQADQYYNLLIKSCQEIANNPKLGKNYKGIIHELFGLKTGRHIIFYRNRINKPIEITRILHGRMDLTKRIFEK
ncbi:type II toxin-antitoxin system RelE/ParE family toxin [Leeuwenhoekiella nanhaiensis]|uniref:Toxin n=1 Tax=Leeuwenhoekiella nanhaiensis TaxID=1655491 RepID=A0A2G1VQZ2_9FLAO|nr:type II toxin-antitoxin system RelE/ParE family toxin [Leeuwenhoekiella nanhaiensis]PHQ28869.1 plasmid stabilization protein [Leeuwenhoekiella nanhaiensis]